MQNEDKKKVVLITGANKGIGAATAKLLGARGYRIALQYRSDPEAAERIVQDISDAKAFRLDLTDEAAVTALVKDVKEHFGRIDALVNNAGLSIDQVLPFAKPEDFSKLLDTNIKPVFLLSKLVSRVMIKQKSGVIVNMSSVVGCTGNAGQSMYAATKAAIIGFTKSIAQDLAPYGIRCNAVAPGFIATAMTDALPPAVREKILATIPLKRLGDPSEVAELVEFLVSERASYITGSTLHINGGMYCN